MQPKRFKKKTARACRAYSIDPKPDPELYVGDCKRQAQKGRCDQVVDCFVSGDWQCAAAPRGRSTSENMRSAQEIDLSRAEHPRRRNADGAPRKMMVRLGEVFV